LRILFEKGDFQTTPTLSSPLLRPFKVLKINSLFLETGTDSPVQVQMRRRFKTDNLHWHCRYIAIPETAVKDVIVRKVIDSLIYSNDMMSFVKSLGLRLFFILEYF